VIGLSPLVPSGRSDLVLHLSCTIFSENPVLDLCNSKPETPLGSFRTVSWAGGVF
jgi:hypothetical protein